MKSVETKGFRHFYLFYKKLPGGHLSIDRVSLYLV